MLCMLNGALWLIWKEPATRSLNLNGWSASQSSEQTKCDELTLRWNLESAEHWLTGVWPKERENWNSKKSVIFWFDGSQGATKSNLKKERDPYLEMFENIFRWLKILRTAVTDQIYSCFEGASQFLQRCIKNEISGCGAWNKWNIIEILTWLMGATKNWSWYAGSAFFHWMGWQHRKQP